MQLIRRYDFLGVAGNHDFVAVGKRSDDDFNYAAKAAIQWTTRQLSEEETDFLANLPPVVNAEPFTMVHGSLRGPVDEYLLAPDAALATLKLLQTPYCLVGHSHLPFICREKPGLTSFLPVYRGRGFFLGPRAPNNQPGLRGSTP